MEARYDVVVVGGGHAGCEAALAAARLGRKTLLLTRDAAALGRMSCNPAIGGLAKGQVVCELDALGGAMPRVADRTGLQFKVLNASRGPAVRGPRCQSDKVLYSSELTREVRAAEGLALAEGVAAGFRVERGRLAGLRLGDGSEVSCGSAVVTTGTFLRGLVHVGEERREEGRWGEAPAVALSGALAALGLRMGRMKTGTPPRVASASVDRDAMQLALGDTKPRPFSRLSAAEPFPRLPQQACWLTHTNLAVHDRIRANLGRSPLYSGAITGRGPRYCPSIEDKVVRFPERERHQIFVEPEGLTTDWLYLNGLSMSLPPAIQEEIVHGIRGLERAQILRPAYAVEYDMVYPEQLDDTLQVRALPGLYLAGQINGTSGYEEAAGQGLVAGVNAALYGGRAHEPLVLGRHEAYIGVMIDDLVTLGTEEPYRLLSSRAEHRLLLGGDTVYARLTPVAAKFGLVSAREADAILERERKLTATIQALEGVEIHPDEETRAELSALGFRVEATTTGAGLVRRPDGSLPRLRSWLAQREETGLEELSDEELERVEISIRYSGYVLREREAVARLARSTERRIPEGWQYRGMAGLSAEAVEKLERHRPRTVGQAGRIPGVPPAAVTILLARVLSEESAARRRGRADDVEEAARCASA